MKGDESEEKITKLFPDDDNDHGVDNSGSDQESSSSNEMPSDDNVLRPDFDRQATVKSPRPKRVVPTDELSQAKCEVFEVMIEEGMVMVTLDPRMEGVEVPQQFQGSSELHLNFSHMFHIDDFDYDQEGVRASLSFQGTRYFCDIPWSSVSRLYSHESGQQAVFEAQT